MRRTGQQGSGGTTGWCWPSGLRGAALPSLGACAPAPGLGPSPRGSFRGQGPAWSAEPSPCSLGPTRKQGLGRPQEPLPAAGSHPASGRRRWWSDRDRAVWNPLCPSGLLPSSSGGKGLISTLGGEQRVTEGGSGWAPKGAVCLWPSLRPSEQGCPGSRGKLSVKGAETSVTAAVAAPGVHVTG